MHSKHRGNDYERTGREVKRERLDDYDRDSRRWEHDRFNSKHDRRGADHTRNTFKSQPARDTSRPDSRSFPIHNRASTSGRSDTRVKAEFDLTHSRFLPSPTRHATETSYTVKKELITHNEASEIEAFDDLDRFNHERFGRSKEISKLADDMKQLDAITKLRDTLEQKQKDDLFAKICNNIQADGEYDAALPDNEIQQTNSMPLNDMPETTPQNGYQDFGGLPQPTLNFDIPTNPTAYTEPHIAEPNRWHTNGMQSTDYASNFTNGINSINLIPVQTPSTLYTAPPLNTHLLNPMPVPAPVPPPNLLHPIPPLNLNHINPLPAPVPSPSFPIPAMNSNVINSNHTITSHAYQGQVNRPILSTSTLRPADSNPNIEIRPVEQPSRPPFEQNHPPKSTNSEANNSTNMPSHQQPQPDRHSFDRVRAAQPSHSPPNRNHPPETDSSTKKMTYKEYRLAKLAQERAAKAAETNNGQSNESAANSNPFRRPTNAQAEPKSTAAPTSTNANGSNIIDSEVRGRNWENLPTASTLKQFKIPKLNRPENNAQKTTRDRSDERDRSDKRDRGDKRDRSGKRDRSRERDRGRERARSSEPDRCREKAKASTSDKTVVSNKTDENATPSISVDKPATDNVKSLITDLVKSGSIVDCLNGLLPENKLEQIRMLLTANETEKNTSECDVSSTTQQKAAAPQNAATKTTAKRKSNEIDRLTKDICENMPDIHSMDKRACTKKTAGMFTTTDDSSIDTNRRIFIHLLLCCRNEKKKTIANNTILVYFQLKNVHESNNVE